MSNDHMIDETHDPARRSWLDSANRAGSDFPVQNLPWCMFDAPGRSRRAGVGIGDAIVDVTALAASGVLQGEALAAAQAACAPELNALMALPSASAVAFRRALSGLLSAGGGAEATMRDAASRLLVPMADARFHVPSRIGGYTDFLTSRYHTERNGRLKGLKDPLPPACLSLPVAYNGRVSSIRISGTDVVRPRGQFKNAEGEVVYGPAVAMDFELEMGAYVREGNELSEPVSVDAAPAKLFGFSLFNDWSAKDIQWWEQVLGPFLGKSFMTTVSPWIVTTEALAPFRCEAAPRLAGDPPLLAHLHSDDDQRRGAFDVNMEAWISSAAMRGQGTPARRLTRARLAGLSWTFAQMLSHHTSNGCNLQPGDFIGSGTVSGEESGTEACMTEITEAGRKPVSISPAETRGWLLDGDEVVFRARAERGGYVPIGFGECRGIIAPARALA